MKTHGTHPHSERILQAAGLLMWGVVGAPAISGWLKAPASLPEPGSAAWLAVYLAWGPAFWIATRPVGRWPSAGVRRGCFVFQAVGALALAYGGKGLSEGALLAAVAAQAPFCLPGRGAFAWVLGQSAALFVIFWVRTSFTAALVSGVAYLAFQAFALGMSQLQVSEAAARGELARVNADLVAAQALLAEGSRTAERLRISRDLHDTLGHHLTALSLNLEVASHLTAGKAAEHVLRAQAVAKLLLGDLRNVVAALREDTGFDLGTAMRALAEGVERPRIHLDLPADLPVRDPGLAQALLRCVQEAITNTVRHAGARNLWIEVASRGGGIEIRARDDGRGASSVSPGHGLTGMRERLEQGGGRLDLQSRPGEGFELRAWMPVEGAAP